MVHRKDLLQELGFVWSIQELFTDDSACTDLLELIDFADLLQRKAMIAIGNGPSV